MMEKIYLKLVKESIVLINPIYITYNGRKGKRTISLEEIRLTIRDKKPYLLYNKKGKEFKYKHVSDESKRIIEKIIEGQCRAGLLRKPKKKSI